MFPDCSDCLFALAALVTVSGGVPALAATGCRVDYQIASQWTGGFGAAIAVTNLGDPLTVWRLTWSFTAGQTVAQAWNAVVTQSGAQVTADNASCNGDLATGTTVTFRRQRCLEQHQQPTADRRRSQRRRLSRRDHPTTAPHTTGWNPPAHLVTPLDQVWQHQEQTYNNGNLYAFRNCGWDQVDGQLWLHQLLRPLGLHRQRHRRSA
ncbi:cellulose binding domain-containing protein [Micromonospora sp. LOL_014]|uniref:cellulose binding domain-containing protein n=1 Tax=Micromonospora sp. LOL_014 TaxID=3345415 RepID=UPI003A8422FD